MSVILMHTRFEFHCKWIREFAPFKRLCVQALLHQRVRKKANSAKKFQYVGQQEMSSGVK